jgi:hypothetical protein
MDSRKVYFGFIGLLILLGIGFLFSVKEANALLEDRSRTLVSLKAESQATADQQAQLDTDKAEIAKYADLNTIAESVVPQDKDQAEAVQEIVNLAAASGITKLGSISFPASTLGISKGLSQVTSVKGIPGVYDLQITITQGSTSLVPYNSFITFLSKIEQNRRTAEVSSINVQPDQANPGMVSFTLVVDEFIKP